VHDDVEATRLEKISKYIAHSALALETLQVCWDPDPGTLNCGRCSKCIWTMLALHIAGVLDRAPTFPSLEPRFVRAIVPGNYRHQFVVDLMPMLDRTPGSAKLRRALKVALFLDRCSALSQMIGRRLPGLSRLVSRWVHKLGIRYPDTGKGAARVRRG
jgi:hypothetical protein